MNRRERRLEQLGLFVAPLPGPVVGIVQERLDPLLGMTLHMVNINVPLIVAFRRLAVNAYMQGFADCCNREQAAGE